MSAQAMTRSQEIRLVAGRELRTYLFKKAAVITNLVLLLLTVGGIVVVGLLTGGDKEPYRLGVQADAATITTLAPALEKVTASNGQPLKVKDLAGADARTALGESTPEDSRPDMVLVTGQAPALLVQEKADEQVVAGITSVLQQAVLTRSVTELGGDPGTVSTALASAVPKVTVLEPPTTDQAGFGQRYAVLQVVSILMYMVILIGGQAIAGGVVTEKGSRIVEILLACVRPTSLLAGKILGIGCAATLTTGAIAVIAAATARVMDVLPDLDVNLDATVGWMLAWMVVGFLLYAVLFAAVASLVSRQEDLATVTMPLILTIVVPYVLSFSMVSDPQNTLFRVLAYLPPFAPFLMPARMTIGVSSVVEQLAALGLAVVTLPLLMRLSATVYTRAVTRTGSRVPLKEVLGRRAR
ncbi:ABC transporter permease [Actinomyces sp. oral taxon 897]|uniref:ABC transporter permease n=1 Tax=Actinomyces sp. oral taxon 897 TaxID=2081702 RepID=UPI000D02EC87|nr:ABC transporter permease [Actinomyces sp. oral taxon 897]AVM62674.1 ABC transporter permease [Actinomyces sp. oral taxon 897]